MKKMTGMKKKLAVIAVALMLVSICSFGTTAYYTAVETAHNVITSGNIAIELVEKDADGNEYFDPKGVLPGCSVDKVVTVDNVSDNACWLRVSVEKAIELAPGSQGEPDLSLVEIDFDTGHWTEKDGFFYYNEALQPGASTEPLFTTVKFDGAMGNMYQNCTATVDVLAQAVQCANNGESALTAAGWPEQEGSR